MTTNLAGYRATTSFVREKIESTFRNYKIGTSAAAELKTTSTIFNLWASSATSIEDTNTVDEAKSTMRSSIMDATSQSYKQRREVSELQLVSSGYILGTVRNWEPTKSNSYVMETTRFHESQLIVASKKSRMTPNQSPLWLMQTNWPSTKSTEALQVILSTENASSGRASSKDASQSLDKRFSTTAEFTTANSNWDWKGQASTVDFLYSEMVSSSRAVEYFPQSSIHGHHFKLETFKWVLWIKIDGNQVGNSKQL